MIQVTVFERDQQITAFEVSGHADSGPYGYDLVCAGVSAITFGAINAVIELCGIDLVIDQGAEGGYLYVEIPPDLGEQQTRQVQLLFSGMIVSLQTIVNDYRQFIHIQYQ